MATEIRPNTGPGSLEYTPGEKTKTGLMCVQAGDRLTFTGWSFKTEDPGNNVEPDNEGYMPHFAITPMYVRDAGLGSGAVADMRRQFGIPTGGTIEKFPFIRVDLGSIWFPYAAEVKIDGGKGPGPGPGTLLITVEWERQRWHINSSVALLDVVGMIAAKHTPASVMNYIGNLFSDSATPVIEKRDQKNPLTFYNVLANQRIQRPANAISVFTPDNVNLQLDNGAGTYSATVRTGSAGKAISLGPFGQVMPVANVTSIEFMVQI